MQFLFDTKNPNSEASKLNFFASKTINVNIELDKLKLADKRKVAKKFPDSVILVIPEFKEPIFISNLVKNDPKSKLEILQIQGRFSARLFCDLGVSKANPANKLKVYSSQNKTLTGVEIADLINNSINRIKFHTEILRAMK